MYTVMVFKLVHFPLSSLSDGKATWCRHFYIQLGANVRRLRVSPRDGHRPEWVYTVGVEVRAGNGRYRNTVIVTLAPRYLKNKIIRQYIPYYIAMFLFINYSSGSNCTTSPATAWSSPSLATPRRLLTLRRRRPTSSPCRSRRSHSTGRGLTGTR